MNFCRCEGNFRHKKENRERNFIKGAKRVAMKEKLKYRKAGKLAADLNRDADIDKVLCGNATSLYGTKVLAQIRHEVRLYTLNIIRYIFLECVMCFCLGAIQGRS